MAATSDRSSVRRESNNGRTLRLPVAQLLAGRVAQVDAAVVRHHQLAPIGGEVDGIAHRSRCGERDEWACPAGRFRCGGRGRVVLLRSGVLVRTGLWLQVAGAEGFGEEGGETCFELGWSITHRDDLGVGSAEIKKLTQAELNPSTRR